MSQTEFMSKAFLRTKTKGHKNSTKNKRKTRVMSEERGERNKGEHFSKVKESHGLEKKQKSRGGSEVKS